MNAKYKKQYFMPPKKYLDWMSRDAVERAPVWCSVDLRDGNQALVEPMNLQTKLDFFDLLVDIGFREIEVGFPAASETEYAFLRALIDGNRIPDNVTIQVLTQARPHIIARTFEAVRGAKNVIVHVYNSTSPAQREQVFRKSKEEIKKIAVDGAKLLQELAEKEGVDYRFEYSPESFTGTEPEYALEVVNAVLAVWKPTKERKAIVNLPATVENAMPHVYAQQIAYICENISFRDAVVISLHPHNDRGTGVAAAEFGLLAGADRVEGTLFGNGERTGNCDIVTLAGNMFSQGVESGLDFSNMPYIAGCYEKYTGMKISPRQPYAGELVFAAFSGSHQDAIAKGMNFRKEKGLEEWNVPYLPVDPKDVGREYDGDVIRINSQSGKGGIGYMLESGYGLKLPPAMRDSMREIAKRVSDERHAELKASDLFELFVRNYIEARGVFNVGEVHFRQGNGITAAAEIVKNGVTVVAEGTGNGRLDAVSNALKKHFKIEYNLSVYEQHALSKGSFAQAVSYVGIEADGVFYWGAGEHTDITTSSIYALVSAVNGFLETKKG